MYNSPSRRVFALTLILSTAACQTWKIERRPVETVVRQHSNDQVAVTMDDKQWVVLREPRLQNDSIVGRRVTGNMKGPARTALPIARVQAVETRKFSFLRTVGFGIMMAFVPSIYRVAFVEEEE